MNYNEIYSKKQRQLMLCKKPCKTSLKKYMTTKYILTFYGSILESHIVY